jgi:hypothetical protein
MAIVAANNPVILNRTAYYHARRNGTFRFADWNLVNTSQGACVEPANINELFPTAGMQVIDIDLDEIAFDRLELLDEAVAFQLLGTWGNQVPSNYNSQ